MNKIKEPRNDKNQPHGYWERYLNGQLGYKCVFINGRHNGFEEQYWYDDGKVTVKNYYL